jgi:hypothetical protein
VTAPRDPNTIRFERGRGRDHVESWFLKANDAAGERALWIKATIFASAREPERPLAEGWAIVLERRGSERRRVALKHTLPFDEAFFGTQGLAIRWGAEGATPHMRMEPGRTSGAIAAHGERIAWDLSFAGEPRPLSLLPAQALYDAPLPKSKLVTPLPDARFDGFVEAFGERWPVEAWRGAEGHNWGTGHAELYAWCHANVFEGGEDFVLEGVSARVRVGPVLTPLTTLVAVRHRGVEYDFDRPIDVARARGDLTLRSWTFSARSRHASIEGSVEADTEDMVGLYYANPQGPMTYCLNSKLARARVRFEADGRPPLVLTSRAAALEIGTRDDAHGVEMLA